MILFCIIGVREAVSASEFLGGSIGRKACGYAGIRFLRSLPANNESPGFLSLIKKSKNSKFPVCLVHTHSTNPGKINGGEIIDTDLIKFMQNVQ